MTARTGPAGALRGQGAGVVLGVFILIFYTPKSTYNYLIYIKIVAAV
jgi:hypothetical protein